MAVRIFWLEDRFPGRLAIGPRPRGGDWLEEDVRAWRSEGVDIVVSLLEPTEAGDLGLDEERDACLREGLTHHALPVPDRGLPESAAPVAALADELARALRAGRQVLVHCRQGIGRSTLLAAAVLATLGLTPDEALARIERARGCPIPDTPEQQRWILAFPEARTALGSLRSPAHPP